MNTQINDWKRVEDTTESDTYKRKFSEIHRVIHVETGELGILKLVDKTKVTPEIVDQLRMESLLSFNVKGLPSVLAIFENEHYFSFVKRYQKGVRWKDYTDTLSDKEFFCHLPLALLQLIEILHIVHLKGFAHGDIKPTNILINANSSTDFQMELIDFGMSYKVGESKADKIPFSLGFAAPELILNRLELTNETTDFYSLAITIYVLVSGKIPLAHPNPEVFINLQLTHPLMPDSKIPKSVFTLIEKMTFKPMFPLPPHLMEEKKLVEMLLESIDKRLNYNALEIYLNNLEIKKKWFKYR